MFAVEYQSDLYNTQKQRKEFSDNSEAFEFYENMRLRSDIYEAAFIENDEILEAYVR